MEVNITDKFGKSKHILVVSQYFYPEQFRINDMCQEWIKRGYRITVLTGIPNYPQGKFFDGYGYLKKRNEIWEGINIIRIPLIPRGSNAIGLVLNYLSFSISGRVWNLFSKLSADIVFIFGVSPMTQASIGTRYAKKNKIPCIFYVQDLWPENVESVTRIHNKYILGSIKKIMRNIYSDCNIIFATSKSMVGKIQERVSENKERVLFMPQYSEDFYTPVDKSKLSDLVDDDKYKIIYTGNIGYAQGLEILPRLALELKKMDVNCGFYIIGDGRYKPVLCSDIKKYDVEDMFFLLGRKQPEEIAKYIAVCDVAFLSFSEEPIYKMTIPAKLQSYMACGIPILAVAGGETKRIIEEAYCGIVIEDGDINNLCHVIKEQLLEKQTHGKNGINYCNSNFNKKKLMDYLDDIIYNIGEAND